MKETSFPQSNILLALFFVCISLFLWLQPFIFFWKDDWDFIYSYFNIDHLSFILKDHNGHIKPLFKIFYFSEIYLFGKNTVFYQIIELILLGITAYLFSCIFREISPKNTLFSLIVPVMLIANPSCGEVTLWVFEVCLILHMLFQASTILFYLKYASKGDRLYLYLFVTSLIFQNYFFGNGIFFPMLFIIVELIGSKFRLSKLIVLLVIIQVIFVFIQMVGSSNHISISTLVSNYSSVLSTFFTLISVSISRLFFIKETALGNLTPYLGLSLFLILFFLAYRNNKKSTLFCLGYILISSISIPLARPGAEYGMHYYYSVLVFPSLLFLIYISVSSLKERYNKIAFVLCLNLLIAYFMADIQMKKIYAYKDFKNKEHMMNAITYSKEYYYPFSENYYVTWCLNLYWDNQQNPSIQRSIQKNSNFELDTGIQAYLQKGPYTSFRPDYVARFKRNSKKIISCYKHLCKNSFIDFDITFEKK